MVEPDGMLIYTNNKGQPGEKLQQSWPSGCTGGVSGASNMGLMTEEAVWVTRSYWDAIVGVRASLALPALAQGRRPSCLMHCFF